MSGEMIEKVARAIESASCPGRQGPFGLFDYTPYGDPVPHHVRDFRSMRSDTYGNSVFKSTDPDEARSVYEKMTREHIARAAIEAMREPTEKMRDRYNDPDVVGYGPDGSDHDKVWQAGIDAALSGDPS